MARYIDADNFMEHIKGLIEECENPDVATQPITYGTVLGLKGALSYAETLPTADVVEVKHGKWLHKKIDKINYYVYGQCSNCLERKRIDNYCPNCGAKMDGGAE